jgi:hypothetical protein
VGARSVVAALSAVALGLAAVAIAAPAGATSGGGSRPLMVITAGGQQAELLAQWKLPGGSVASRWQVGNNVVVVAGAPGTVVGVSGTGGSLGITATPSAALAKASEDPQALAAKVAASGGSVYWDALAVGATPAEAAQMTLALHVPLPAGVAAAGGARAGADAAASPSSVGGPEINFTCDHGSADGGSAQGTACACMVQRLDDASAGTDYVDDDVVSTSSENAAALSSLCWVHVQDYYRYPGSRGDHTAVDWEPSASVPVGTPTDKSWGISVLGGTLTASETVYPNGLTPILEDPWGSVGQFHAGFEMDWAGSEGSAKVADDYVDLFSTWTDATNAAGIYLGVDDNWWC